MEESFDVIVKKGMVVLKDEILQLDIGIRDGKIARLANSIEAETKLVIDADGQYVLPGMVDVHVHLNEPGLGAWEGFASGSAALAAGGCTTYADMPLNGVPPTVTAAALELKRQAADGHSAVDYALWGGLVPGNLAHLEALAEAGVIGFKAFMSAPGGEGEDIFREVDELTLYEGMRRIAELGGILALHAENEALVSALAARKIAEGRVTAMDFVESRPVVAELEAVNRALFYAELTGCALHFVHISSPEAVKRIVQAKHQGMNVTLETCPHYLILTAEDMQRLGAVAKCAPPLRSKERQELLWQQVREGLIDMIASDHSPCPEPMKTVQKDHFFGAWGGISGAQSSMELIIHEGFIERGISLTQLSRMLSYAPAERFGLHPRKGEIAVSCDADLVLVDTNRSYVLTKENLLQRHPHSPYLSKIFSCQITATLCRGKLIYDVDHGILAPGAGNWIKRDGSYSNSASLPL
jgi:allantoinase